MTLVRAHNLIKEYEDGRVQALRGVSLEIHRGQFVAIRGPSGSGKTTLLHLLGAMDRPTSGEVWLDGVALSREPRLDRLRARMVGFIFQMHHLVPVLTARQNVEMAMVPLGVGRPGRRRRAAEMLQRVGLASQMDRRVTCLSGGERQRVAVARALVNRPPLILADEPTGNLDSRTGQEVMQVLHEIRREVGSALVLVTHNPEICAGAVQHLWMRDGTIGPWEGPAWEHRETSSSKRGD